MLSTPSLLDSLYSCDVRLFQAIHPLTAPSSIMLLLARVLAECPLLLTAGLLTLMVVLPRYEMRLTSFKAGGAALVALGVNGLIGLAWDRPRPFMAGLGQAWVHHAANGSFPSDHVTLQWVVAGTLLLDRRTRPWGIVIAMFGLPLAWARVYLGVHYPGDMLGALMIAIVMTLLMWALFFRRTGRIAAAAKKPEQPF